MHTWSGPIEREVVSDRAAKWFVELQRRHCTTTLRQIFHKLNFGSDLGDDMPGVEFCTKLPCDPATANVFLSRNIWVDRVRLAQSAMEICNGNSLRFLRLVANNGFAQPADSRINTKVN